MQNGPFRWAYSLSAVLASLQRGTNEAYKKVYFWSVMEHRQISSIRNPLAKKILLLKEKPRERKKTGLFVVEGQREIELALKGSYTVVTILYSSEIFGAPPATFKAKSPEANFVEITPPVYKKIAYRQSTEGIVAICKSKEHTLDQIKLKRKNPLLLVAEALEKPGNIGALLRTADAAGLDAILIADPKSDLYNPNIIRSSVGCVFTKQIGTGSTENVIDFLKKREIKIHCAALSASKNHVDIDFKGPSAIVVGTEATGLSKEWLENSDENLIVPMQGEIDSMNVSVSAAILIFEAKRQRGF